MQTCLLHRLKVNKAITATSKILFTVKLGNLSDALACFKNCLTLAEVLDDIDSQEAIKKAMEEVNSQIVENLQQPTATQDD